MGEEAAIRAGAAARQPWRRLTEGLFVPTYSDTVAVDAPPAQIFAILEDVARTPEFHRRCTEIETLDESPVTVGKPLRYHYRDGPRRGVMSGRVEACEPGRRLRFQFGDSMTDVHIDFRLEPVGTAATSLTHTVTIHTKGLAKLLTPLIVAQLRRQAPADLQRLKVLAEMS
jgi:uncharacterized protein YndB with AHSA1/START domain